MLKFNFDHKFMNIIYQNNHQDQFLVTMLARVKHASLLH
jgi:hypothetical protein